MKCKFCSNSPVAYYKEEPYCKSVTIHTIDCCYNYYTHGKFQAFPICLNCISTHALFWKFEGWRIYYESCAKNLNLPFNFILSHEKYERLREGQPW